MALDGAGSTIPFQFDWLTVEDGALLKLNTLGTFAEDTWYTLFRNVNEPLNEFTVTGLGVGQVADFQYVEYTPGFYDYQVMVSTTVPEPTALGLGAGAGLLLLTSRRRRQPLGRV